MQLQYVQLTTDKTNTADLSSGVFAILISVPGRNNTEFIVVPHQQAVAAKEALYYTAFYSS